jgi:MFS family permease
MGGVIVGATVAGRLMARLKHYKRPPVVGLAVAALGTLLLALRATTLSLPVLELVLAATGIGLGTLLPVTTVAVQNAVPMHQLGTATGAMGFFRSLGGAIAVAIFGAIVLGGITTPGTGADLEGVRRSMAAQAADIGSLFDGLFLAASIGFAVALGWLLAMEERPLRGGAPKAPDAGPEA